MTTLSLDTVPQQQLMDLINQDNISNLSLADVAFSDPVAGQYYRPEGMRNTKVTVKALPSSSFSGTVDVFYDRIDLADIGYAGILTAEPPTANQFLQMASNQLGVSLLTAEFNPIILPSIEVGEILQVTLTALPTSVKWIGETVIDYALTLPDGLDDLHQLLHVTLPADNYLLNTNGAS